MAGYENLPLVRIEIVYDRKKRPGFGSAPIREYVQHAEKLETEIENLLEAFKSKPLPSIIKPELILKVKYDSSLNVDDLRRSGLHILGGDPNNALILFATKGDLSDFTQRLNEYKAGPKDKAKNPAYNNFFANIESVTYLTREDRIGAKLKTIEIEEESFYWIDIELWHLGDKVKSREKMVEIKDFIAASEQGRATDDFIGSSLCLIRANVSGKVINELSDLDIIYRIDLPSKPTFYPRDIINIPIEQLPKPKAPFEDAPGICVIDSGVLQGNPFLAKAIGDTSTFPGSLGDPTDVNGHGTLVAGIAIYGNVLDCILNDSFQPDAVLYSARVTNEYNCFDNDKLITSQMREAITYFYEQYACRIFNISLGDKDRPFVNGKQPIWAATLDELARELDIVVVISAGNYDFNGDDVEKALTEYPSYLSTPEAKIIDPASAALAVTVGSVCPDGGPIANLYRIETMAHNRPIGESGLPSPFTRCGPGVNGIIKPELCEVGGSLVYNGLTHRTTIDQGLSVLSTSKYFPERIFDTDIGTSFAAPKIANQAARILREWPSSSSANLIRSLLIHCADIPFHIAKKYYTIEEALNVYGYGIPDARRVVNSYENLVNLYAEAALDLDKMHIYEVPIPKLFNQTKGDRRIIVTLAFNPPVRYTRLDYLGIEMSFRLIRGKSLSEVAESFRARRKDEGKVDTLSSSKFECKMFPGAQLRDRGTVQKGIHTIGKNTILGYGENYYLVVRCENNWATEEMAPQDYSVVVSVEHSSQEVKLYEAIRTRVTLSTREKIKVKRVKIKL
ncbi:MAG: S8 family peptidase [Desulfitobacterium hafniense]|nr:S8 family peptidase [Desulfitobacterium hafniense]